MATAWELTSVAGWREQYEITVYQMGWRLGGKGASGRNALMRSRIQEHGLHMWMGFYENAFTVIREAYNECAERNLMPGSPFRSYKDAFSAVNVVSITETEHGSFVPWTNVLPETDSWPGESAAPRGVQDHGSLVWYYVVRILELLTAEFDQAVLGMGHHVGWFPANWWTAGLRALESPLHKALDAAHSLPLDPASQRAGNRDVVADLVDDFAGLFVRAIEIAGDIFSIDPVFRRLAILLDTGLALVRGIVRDNIIGRGFSVIDGVEFASWLASHGCRRPRNPITCAFYDACFAYVNGSPRSADQNMAAGTMLNGLLRLVLAYNKSIMLAMNAGMGDTIFSPLYLALKDRGVKFEFFHKVTRLGLSEDHINVDRIEMDVQATPRADYQPLVQVKGVYCWPSEPLWDQLVNGQAIRQTAVNNNLESWWCAVPPAGAKVLTRGTDFDIVVNGISLGALPFLCQELIDASPAWRAMIAQVQLVRTQAFQLWLHSTAGELGWNPGPAGAGILTGFVEPFDTWADMGRLIAVEDFQNEDRCRGIAYFCNALENDGPLAPFTDPTYPGRQTDRVQANARKFVDQDLGKVWPAAVGANGFRPEVLVNAAAGDPFDNQFFRANVDPSELYVLSTAASIAARLPPGQSGFANLVLAGDWTQVELNIGCVEAAVQSGKMAANAICGQPKFISGPFGIRLPIKGGALE